MTTTVALVGATGKLGSQISGLIGASDDFELVAALSSQSDRHEMLQAELIVDVTHPAVSIDIVETAVRAGKKVLVGTSGWSKERISGIVQLSAEHPGSGVVFIPNFSIGSVLASACAAMMSTFFDSIEIVEAHHAGKVDSPSGTAVRTAELIAAARAATGPVAAPHSDQRARGQLVAGVPIHSLRVHGVVASQQVHLGGTGETVTISHETVSSDAYHQGIMIALRAARHQLGVVTGLDSLIDLGFARSAPGSSTPSGDMPSSTDEEAR